MKIHLKLKKTEKYILTCSFGPDSMCLFSLLFKEGYDFVVAHVNYHLREEEPSEMIVLTEYCKTYNVPLYTYDVYMPKGVNEEGWARVERYEYFNRLSEQLGIKNVLIAHNQDDLLETYLLQKARGNIVQIWGLAEKHHYKNMVEIRPLLSYKKADLKSYCDENKIPYGIDKSNFDTSYKRNAIRKNIVKDMPSEKREELLLEIKKQNEKLNDKISNLKPYLTKSTIIISNLPKLSVEDFQLLLILYFEKKSIYYPISRKFAGEFLKIVESKKNWHKKLLEETYFEVDYGEIGLYQIIKPIKEDLYKINSNSKYYYLLKDKEPVSFKINLKTFDVFELNGVKKKVGRCFIDWKIPYVYRLVWPGIYSKDGKLLYLPHYQKNYTKSNKDSLLEFNLKDFIK